MEGSCRGSGGYRAPEGGAECGGCRCAMWWWREARWEEIQQPIVWGGQELTHEKGSWEAAFQTEPEHQSGALHWSPDSQRVLKVSVFEEMMFFELLMGWDGATCKYETMESKGRMDTHQRIEQVTFHTPFNLWINNISNEWDADGSMPVYRELFLVQNANFLNSLQVAWQPVLVWARLCLTLFCLLNVLLPRLLSYLNITPVGRLILTPLSWV